MGLLLIVAAAMTWGTTGATMKLIAAGSPMSPLLVGFLRVAIAAPCLCLAAQQLGGPIRCRHAVTAAVSSSRGSRWGPTRSATSGAWRRRRSRSGP